MKSLSASKYKINNSFATPEKKKSRVNTQSTMKLSGEMMSVQSYLYEQVHLKEEASKKEIIRLIRQTIDEIEKKHDIKQVNKYISQLLIGLRTCIHQQEITSHLIQLIQIVREITSQHSNLQQIEYDNERIQLMQKIHELEIQAKENQRLWELKYKELQGQQKIQFYQDQLQQIKNGDQQSQQNNIKQKKNKDENQRNELKLKIKSMQEKIKTLSEKEKKLISLVKAVKSRGIDVEQIYKNLGQISSNNSRITKNSSVTLIESSNSEFADVSQLDIGQAIIKRNTKFLMD